MKKGLLLLTLCGGVLLYNSCTKDHASLPVAPSGCSDSITYTLRVAKILNTYCANTGPNTTGICHDASAANPSTITGTTVWLYNYSTAVTAFKTQNALCYAQHNCTPVMPAAGAGLPDSLQTVPADTLAVLNCWITNSNYAQ